MYFRQQPLQEFQVVARKIVEHDCQLPLRTDNRIHYYIREGCFVNFRRKFRTWLMLDKHHPHSKDKMRSTAQMETEIRKHLTEHYHIIHPFSKVRFWWEMLMMVVYFIHLTIFPIAIVQRNQASLFYEIKFALIGITLLDMILWFFTGYYDVKRQRIEMRPKKICCHYLRTFFIVDLLPMLPLNTIQEQVYDPEIDHALLYLNFVFFLKIFRLHTLLRYLDLFTAKIRLGSLSIQGLKFLISYFFLIMWLVGAVGLMEELMETTANDGKNYNMTEWLQLAVMVTSGLFLIGYNPKDFETDSVEWHVSLIRIMLVYFGSILNILVLSQVMQLLHMRMGGEEGFKSLNKQISEYMKYKSLSPFLRSRILRYVKFKFQNTVLRENEIWKTLNRLLKEDILFNTCKTLIHKVEFFKDLPMPVLLRIITKLRSEIHLPNDTVVTAGVGGNSMYFIYIGTVAVYTSTDKEICHLNEGDHFGEIAILRMEPRTATVAAVTDCELLKLNRRDFQEAIEPFPELREKINKLAMARMQTTRNIMSGSIINTKD